jgi:hypothetical protein
MKLPYIVVMKILRKYYVEIFWISCIAFTFWLYLIFLPYGYP